VSGGRPAILLDRDGTIIVERGYLDDPALVELEVGAAQGLRRLAEQVWPLAVVTNQSGIARGYFDRATTEAVNARVAQLLVAEGVRIEGWYVCPHGPGDGCDCRKPRPGLALQAARELGFDLGHSWMVGDKLSDIALAGAVGARGMLVLTGYAGEKEKRAAQEAGAAIAADLREAAAQILAMASPHDAAQLS
jgi:histidinol-phosphate phosphatase family protein